MLGRYAELLAVAADERGLLGPREASRLWERHLLNCAVIAALIPPGSSIVDVGSGPGLPGLPIAIVRPDCRVVLLEPTLRRVEFLHEVVSDLGIGDRVTVDRGRAEDRAGWLRTGVVTARAVAPLARLLPLTLPLVAPGGMILAIKGMSAERELADIEPDCLRLGVRARVQSVGEGIVDPLTTVVVLEAPPSGATTAR